MVTATAQTIRMMGKFLPAPAANGQIPAQKFVSGRMTFDHRVNAGSIHCVARWTYTRPVMGHYRYPSLNGRSDVPKVRPPALFLKVVQAIVTRQFFAGVSKSLELLLRPGVNLGIRITTGDTERCAEQKSWPWLSLALQDLQHVAARLANRHWLVVPLASAPQQSRTATSAPVLSSAQQPTSHTVSRTPARAGASADLTTFFRRAQRPRDTNELNPVAARLPRGFCMSNRPGQAGANDRVKSRAKDRGND